MAIYTLKEQKKAAEIDNKKWLKDSKLAIHTRKKQKKIAEIESKKWLKIHEIGYLHPKEAEEGCGDRAIYNRKEQKKAAEIDTKKWLKIHQIGYLHPKEASEGCGYRQQKMAKNSPNWLFIPERSRRRLRISTQIKWLKIP